METNIRTMTGGAYIPPYKLKRLQQNISDKSCEQYQRISWDALKKTINGLIMKVNKDNMEIIVKKLLNVNIVRARGVLARTILVNQENSPALTDIYAAVIAVINAKFPQIGLLIVRRLLNDFRKAFKRNDKKRALTCCKLFGHLVNQYVVNDLIMLELMCLLLHNATNTSVEIAVGLMKEVGARMDEVHKAGTMMLYDKLRQLLNEGDLDKRVNYMIEVLFQIRKDKYRDYPPVRAGLDMIDADERQTHLIELMDEVDTEDALNVFKFDSDYLETEKKYENIKETMFEDEDESEGDDSDADEEKEETEPTNKTVVIEDRTYMAQEQLRKKIYLTIQSSLTSQETVHKLLLLPLRDNQLYDMASMVLDYCAQLRIYEPRAGEMASTLCLVNPKYVEQFEKLFCEHYPVMHRLEMAKIINIACFFAHLFVTDSISWGVLFVVHLRSEETTTASGRIFLKYLFTEMRDSLGTEGLVTRFQEDEMQSFFQNMFPRDNLAETKFSINFFTAIELGKLTVELRKFYEAARLERKAAATRQVEEKTKKRKKSSSDSDSDSSSSSSSSSSSTEERARKKKKKHAHVSKKKSKKH